MKITIQDVDISDKIKDFAQYLQTTDRIILSAKFGDGKTYMLNKLRNNLREVYDFFTIYPINYSVAKNEDVFEYIKRDIIIQLQERGFLDNIDMETLFDSIFSFEDLASIVSFLLSFTPMGGFYDKVFNKFYEKKKLYEEKKHTSDKYLAAFANMKGCIYEKDGYTTLIRNAIEWISQDHTMNGVARKKKKPVLIIEDLDRLDPKHLFRILNVISAHIDNPATPDKVGNKFGFHNIVLVMDYDTTKHIFQHFYGEQACYEGYMSKFLSRKPFKYSILPYIITEVEEQLAGILRIPNLFATFVNFRRKLAHSSLRDLHKQIGLDTEQFIKQSEYVYCSIALPTALPLFHLIIYMMESGLTAEEIATDLIFAGTQTFTPAQELTLIEHLQLLYPIYLTYFNDLHYVRINNRTYHLVLDKTEQGVISVRVNPMGSWTENTLLTLPVKQIKDTVLMCLDRFSSSINLSALHSYNE
ncbi:MAG: P-loop NTPase fold protein [Prevotella koreensis]|uniref:P-loop NTPase fold protein n=1 Tax=Prevotella koreensis TaxID=2490854 RepID=UPI003FA185E0